MILGHSRQVEYFNKILSRGRLAHAYLFCGPEYVGKFTFAKALAKTLFCEKSPEVIGKFCGSCRECLVIDMDVNPNVILLDIEHTLVSKKEKRYEIPIGDVQEIRRKLSLAPEGENWRVVIINEAEKLSSDAADAFLKILEEPGEKTLFILITSAKDALLPTIISRTQPVRFSLVSDDTLLEFVKKSEKDQKRQELILAISAGRPGVAVRLLEEKGYLEGELKFLKSIDSILSKKDIPEALILAEKAAVSEEMRGKTIEYVLRILRKNLLDTSGDKNTYETVVRLKNIARDADILGTTNVNPRLAMDNIFLEAIGTNSTNSNR